MNQSSFMAVYRLLLRSLATRGRLGFVLAVDVFIVIIAIAVSASGEVDADMSGYDLINGLGLFLLVPVAALLFATSALGDLREDGSVPWDWLVDHTRSVFQPRTFDGIEGLLQDSAKLYRRDLMRQQKVAIQVWAESDSIGSVMTRVTDRYCIPTFIGGEFLLE